MDAISGLTSKAPRGESPRSVGFAHLSGVTILAPPPCAMEKTALAKTMSAIVALALCTCSARGDGPVGGVTDPISMPPTPSLALTKVPSADSCRDCHPQQFAEWIGSRHGNAMSDRLFQALVRLRQRVSMGEEDRFCVQCHSVVGSRSGDVRPGFDFSALSAVTMEGVSCATCHGSAEVLRPSNAGLSVPGDGVIRGGLDDPARGAPHQNLTALHLQGSLFCAACHEVYELSGLSLEQPYQEWLASPAAAAGQTCQGCHMPRYDGQAAAGGPQRTGLRSHRFVGLDPPGAREGADPTVRAAFAADLAALLDSAASIDVRANLAAAGATLDVVVNVQNRIAGHSLPTGSTFLRQCWLELIVADDLGHILYESGTLDGNGDLRDRWSTLEPFGDPDLISFSSQLIDNNGAPTLFPWEAATHHRNALRAGETRVFTYFVPVPTDAVGSLHLSTRLRMRSTPPFLLRLLDLSELLPGNAPRDLATASATATLK